MVPILILAAGQGRRLGRVKALAPWKEGTLLDDALYRGRQASGCLVAAVGAGESLVRSRTGQRPTYWCPVPDWHEGQSRSLQAGLRTLSMKGFWSGALVMLVDQPLIPASHLQALVSQAGKVPDEAVGTCAGNRCMAPAYLPRGLWPRVFQLEGDRGAGGILNALGAKGLECEAAAQDIDTRAELLAARHRERGG
ncbi:molybdenum cofactor cytidylyltransferase/nicotine blue oxidoreductase [Halospina denitrificans]|uniref:Molybdenum cofactor cytidylyltransferase/nicotine blue oxidoreductase n=1 Tax=Halospina denitrificans TaxID=332522 RepID=A0A4R7JNP1_9GAMM|nr:nucleotidyltransferase family protein [Halospina denitrificans]TDT39344.1 molybdenum cofactor cytidylyltransferase/nicotine blue oxidoreductase [Halospina denitrificans]